MGDAEILLGVLAKDDGIAAEALSSLGITLEGAREEASLVSDTALADALSSVGVSLEEVRRRVGDDFELRDHLPGRLPFSPQAKKALEQSLYEALRLRDNRISGEHILLGLLRVENGHGVRVLGNLGVTARAVEDRLKELRLRV